MWENMGKASRDWTNQREQSQEELVLEESQCFWWRWQCGQRCGVVFAVYREGAADGNLPEMHRMTLMCRGQVRRDIPEIRCAALCECVRQPWVPFQWSLKVALWWDEFGPKQPIHLLVCGASWPDCLVPCEASTMEHGISSHLGRLGPWKHLV